MEAIPLVIASKAIGGKRPVNMELPKYAAGLIKFCTGKGSIFEHAMSNQWTVTDEEILAFAVGDMHGMYRGRGFPDIWDRSAPRKRLASDSESDESMVSESTGSMWNGEIKHEFDDEDEKIVTWGDVLELVTARARDTCMEVEEESIMRNQVPNRMAIQNLI